MGLISTTKTAPVIAMIAITIIKAIAAAIKVAASLIMLKPIMVKITKGSSLCELADKDAKLVSRVTYTSSKGFQTDEAMMLSQPSPLQFEVLSSPAVVEAASLCNAEL